MNFRGFLSLLLVTVLVIHASSSHCTNGMCEKVSLSLATDTKQNFTLVGYVFEKFSSLWSWQQCFNICLKNCQCLSFNFNEVNTTENCELNDANTKLAPKALEQKEGVIYYELARNYYDKKVRNFSSIVYDFFKIFFRGSVRIEDCDVACLELFFFSKLIIFDSLKKTSIISISTTWHH